MLLLTRTEIENLLNPDVLVEALAEAMADLSSGSISMPPRITARVEKREALLAAMPAFVPSAKALTTKLVSLFPQNEDRPTHQAVILCFDADNGTPLALLDGTYITEARTAAGSALATRLLAREDADVLAILGTGVQARGHARAVTRARSISEVRVAGRNVDKAERFARDLAGELNANVVAVADYESALEGADIVCACTHSPEPVVQRRWLSPGTHVNSVGYNTQGREVDAETVADALVVVESRAAALAPPPSGSIDLLWPIRDGVIDEKHIHAEIGELILGNRPGRSSADQITLYKSVGVAAQDAAAAALVLRAAAQAGAGTTIEL